MKKAVAAAATDDTPGGEGDGETADKDEVKIEDDATPEPSVQIEASNEDASTEVVDAIANLEINDSKTLKDELNKAESKIKELENLLASAQKSVSQLAQKNEDLSAKASNVEEFEEGPGPQVGGEASGDVRVPTLEVDSLNQKIESLNVENEYLSDKVYTLEAKVANLIAINKRVSLDFPRGESPDFDSDASLASPLPSIKDSMSTGSRNNNTHHRPRMSSVAEMDLYGEASRIPAIEKEMERWKGWQVDMRGWRSLGIGPTFEI